MTGTPLRRMTLRVQLEGRDAYQVSTGIPDHEQWITTARKHEWPEPEHGPSSSLLWLAFLAWAASRRTGKIEPAMTWAQFAEVFEAAETIKAEQVPPTDPGRGPG